MVDRWLGMWFNQVMTTTNRNSNTVSTVWLADGTRVTFQHRNSLGGWVNGLKRRGVDPSEVVDSLPGLTDSDRVVPAPLQALRDYTARKIAEDPTAAIVEVK